MKAKVSRVLFALGFISIFLISCKKNTVQPSPDTPPTTAVSGSRDELTKDSIYLYTKELYYWNTSLPTFDAFKPRSFSTNEAELYALTQYSNDPLTGKPYEYVSGYTEPKYSYIDYVKSTSTKVASLKADLSGSASDFGFSVKYNSTSDLRVKYVYDGSSAAQNGLTRGCKVISINGNSNLTYSNSAIDFLNNALFGTNSSITLTFVDLNNQTKSATITNATYSLNPILYTNVYTVNNTKVGYLVFNSFIDKITSALNTVFTNFASQGVTELVVDLRYNGGGYVSTATQLINLISPSSQTGKTMFTSYYNSYLSGLTNAQRKSSVLVNQPLLDDQGKLQTYTSGVNGKYATYADLDYTSTSSDNIEKFAKLGLLNLNRVYFLVGGSTASAAELTINSLKPAMDVKLIGSTTYGKPVGFFAIRIDKLDLYTPEFETKNQLGVGGYYSGLTVDKSAIDDVSKAWGDQSETMLANALQHIKTGAYITTTTKTATLKTGVPAFSSVVSDNEIKTIDQQLDQNNFNGMVVKPKGLKLKRSSN